MKKILYLFNNKFLRGGALLTITNFLVGFLNYLFNSLAGKALGPAKYSEITALFSYLLILSVPMTTISTEIIRRLGQIGETRQTVITSWEVWIWSVIRRWSFLLVPYFLLIFIVPRLTNLSADSSVTLQLVLILSILSVFYVASLLGLHLIWAYSLVVVISTLVKLVGPVLVLFQIGDLRSVLVFVSLSSLFMLILAKVFLQRTVGKVLSYRPLINKRLSQLIFSKSIIYIFVTTISINLLYNLDVIFVKKFFPAQEAGLYGAWNLYAKIIYYVLSPILTVSFIFFSAKEQKKRHTKAFFLSIILLIFVGIGSFLFYRIFADFTILFIFSRDYLALKPLLPYAAVFGITYCLISFVSGFFLAKNSYKAVTIFPFILIYAASLALFAKGLLQVVYINIIFSTLIFSSYLLLVFLENRKK